MVKKYIKLILETLLTFTIASFCIAMYFIHTKGVWFPLGLLLVALYAFIIVVCVRRLAQTLPFPALMLMIPILPLVPLVLVLIFIPLMQLL